MKAKEPLVADRQAGQRRDQDEASPGARGRRGGGGSSTQARGRPACLGGGAGANKSLGTEGP